MLIVKCADVVVWYLGAGGGGIVGVARVVDGGWVVTVLLFVMHSRVLGLSTRRGNLGSAGFSCFRGVLYCGKERGVVVL